MKFTTVFAVIATVVAAVSATTPTLTNAKRLARGLPLLPPVRRGTTTHNAARSQPSSGIYNSCNSGPVQCCDTVTSANPVVQDKVRSLIGVVVGPNVAVGLTCSPLSVIGGGATSCNSQPVCCENNSFNGVVAIGCSPVNVNLV